jgi:hypothetical protein
VRIFLPTLSVQKDVGAPHRLPNLKLGLLGGPAMIYYRGRPRTDTFWNRPQRTVCSQIQAIPLTTYLSISGRPRITPPISCFSCPGGEAFASSYQTFQEGSRIRIASASPPRIFSCAVSRSSVRSRARRPRCPRAGPACRLDLAHLLISPFRRPRRGCCGARGSARGGDRLVRRL